MNMQASEPNILIRFENDMYRMHRRPGHPHIILNDAYKGVKIVDPIENKVISEHIFPEPYGPGGIIDNWFFSADGNKMLVVAEDDHRIALIDFKEDQASCMIEYPPVKMMSNITYLWNDTFLFESGLMREYFLLKKTDNAYSFIHQKSIDVRIRYASWRNTADQIYRNDWITHTVDSNTGDILYFDYQSNHQKIGIINWNSGISWSIDVDEDVHRFDSDGKHMATIQDYGLKIYNDCGNLVFDVPSPDLWRFWNAHIIPGETTRPSACVILSSSLQKNLSQLLVYFMPNA